MRLASQVLSFELGLAVLFLTVARYPIAHPCVWWEGRTERSDSQNVVGRLFLYLLGASAMHAGWVVIDGCPPLGVVRGVTGWIYSCFHLEGWVDHTARTELVVHAVWGLSETGINTHFMTLMLSVVLNISDHPAQYAADLLGIGNMVLRLYLSGMAFLFYHGICFFCSHHVCYLWQPAIWLHSWQF